MKSTRIRIMVSNPNQSLNPTAVLAIFIIIGLLAAGIVARYASQHRAAYTATEIRR